MSVVSQRFTHIDRFKRVNTVSKTRKLTLEMFRVSRFNKALTVLVWVAMFTCTIAGNYSMPIIQYMFTFLIMAATFYGMWTFKELVALLYKDEDES